LPAYLTTFERVLRGTSGIRRAGAAALDLCDLACGRLDAFFEFWLMPWDVAAGALIVREAGGVFERLPCGDLDSPPSGSPDLSTAGIQPGGFLAANERLAGEFRTLVRAEG
jgi:fructose-1,6-bisphosphatase/inositol monophosphatase family enzyme